MSLPGSAYAVNSAKLQEKHGKLLPLEAKEERVVNKMAEKERKVVSKTKKMHQRKKTRKTRLMRMIFSDLMMMVMPKPLKKQLRKLLRLLRKRRR